MSGKNRWYKGFNKMLKVSVMAVCILLLSGLAGCIGEREEDWQPLEKGTLKVGMNLNIPFMCELSEETKKPQGFEVEVAQNLADKLGLKLEITDTSQENLLKSLDGDIYDCVISAVGLAEWNEAHYSHTMAYADISSVKEAAGITSADTQIAVFTKKGNVLSDILDKKLQELGKAGTLKEISQKYFEKDITVK